MNNDWIYFTNSEQQQKVWIKIISILMGLTEVKGSDQPSPTGIEEDKQSDRHWFKTE